MKCSLKKETQGCRHEVIRRGKIKKIFLCFQFSSFPILVLTGMAATAGAEIRLNTIKLPPGFTIETYATNVEGARSLALGPDGIVFVGSRSPGKVYALLDRNRDQKAEQVIVVARGLNSPNGVAYRGGALYVAEISRILRFDDIAKMLAKPPQPVVVNDTFPKDAHHGWKFIAFGPDGKLYVPVGAPCNVCFRDDPRYASIMRLNPDGSGLEVFAEGVRNTVGFDWHPGTKELWFTDNGRDWLGNDVPPDELNCAPRRGMHFGFPYCHGGTIPDPEWGGKRSCREFVPPRRNLGPHVAALGMRFYTGAMFPAKYKDNILIAEHGSWNRLPPIGYRISRVTEKGGVATGYEVFAEGWLQGLSAWGRPVDVLVMPDGALLVSDDKADAVYRISYKPPK
jgi:glucose/arabinose dehydrogenase